MKKIILLIALLTGVFTSVYAQRTINGTVSDTDGQPIFGATVAVKGTSYGATTDTNGKFTLRSVSESDVVVIQFLGYESQEVKPGNQNTLQITLQSSAHVLDEMSVVAVGYGSARKRDLTGSIASLNVEDIAATATLNFDEALAGRITGLQVTSSDGTPGEAMNIVIRGGNSITGDNSPLYVIDGIPTESFDPASLSTRDIKSFDVLKDASATAIYGARGANGVILITTNSGRMDGKTDISFHASSKVQYISQRLEVMDGYQYVQHLQKIAWSQDNYVPGTYTSRFNQYWVDPELYRDREYTSWQDEIFRTSVGQSYNFTINSGTERTSIYYNGSFTGQDGTLINTGFQKYNNRLKFNSTFSDAIKFSGQLSYDYTIRSGLQVSGNERNSVIRDAVVFRPVEPIYSRYDEEDENQDVDPYLYNPVATLQNTQRKRLSDIISGNLNVNIKLLKKLTLNSTGNYGRTITEESLFYGEDTQQAKRTSNGINGSVTHRKTQILTNSNTLHFNDKKGKSSYEILLGQEIQDRLTTRSYLRNTNLTTDVFGIDNLGLATTPTLATTSKSQNILLSYFGRANYNYDDRYLATLNFRADGSSKFAPQNRWGYFPSFSVAWRVSEESFLRNVKEISSLKIRAGWGVTGNNRIGDYDAFNLMAVSSSSGSVYGNGETYHPGAYQSNMGVPDLKWEVTSQLNAGIDFGLFKNRIGGTVDLYEKRTKDLLLNAQMAPSTGFNTVQQNVGEVMNRGFEISIDAAIIKKRNFRWNSNFNISFNRNKVVRLNSGQMQMLTDPQWDVQYIGTEYQYATRVGQPVGMIYLLEFDGLYQMDDFVWVNGGTYHLKEGIPTYGGRVMEPGTPKFKDQPTIDTNGDGIPDKGDGVINDDDRVIVGNPHPKHIGGFSNTFRYKNLDVQVLLQWAYGFDILNANKAEFGTYVTNFRNGFTNLTNAWTPTNTDTDVSGFRFNGNTLIARNGYKVDSRYVEDGSYLKVKSVVIGYRIPDRIIKRTFLQSCRFTLSGQNLYTFTRYSGYDPDVSVGRYGAMTPGLDYSAYPQSVSVSFGIDVKF